jgi:hypothetical protein
MTAVLFAIGYERRTQAGLLDDLTAAGVTLLADLRELPLSRRAGCSKTALAGAVEGAGIEYRHLRPLGNPKAARDAWKRGDAAAGIAGYRDHLREVPAAVASLAERVAQGGVCLLCVEHDPAKLPSDAARRSAARAPRRAGCPRPLKRSPPLSRAVRSGGGTRPARAGCPRRRARRHRR